MSRKYAICKSFRFAFDGLKTAIRKEPNFRIHLVAAISAIFAAYLLGFSSLEWIILVLTIFLVLIFELMNTALETLIDLISPEITPQAKIAKDISAAAVLSTAFLSIIVGLTLFLPKILLIFTK
ncbi:MAG: diacylglycerol kinase family protein [Microgenomates group bacterium]